MAAETPAQIVLARPRAMHGKLVNFELFPGSHQRAATNNPLAYLAYIQVVTYGHEEAAKVQGEDPLSLFRILTMRWGTSKASLPA